MGQVEQATKPLLEELQEHFAPDVSTEAIAYARDVLLVHSRYIFLEAARGQLHEAYCTHCQHYFYVEALIKVGTRGTCPNCHSSCTYKHAWRSRKNLVDGGYFLYFEKSICNPQVVTATWYYARHDLTGYFHRTLIELIPTIRFVFDCERHESHMMERWFWNKNWHYIENVITPSFLAGGSLRGVAEQSIESAIAGTQLAYSDCFQYALTDIPKYFALVLKYPSIEILTKAGKTATVQAKLYGLRTYSAVNWRATKLHHIFKVSKQDFAWLEAKRADLLDYRLWQQARKEKSQVSVEDLMKYINQFRLDEHLGTFKFLRKYSTMHRIFNYANKQFIKNKKHYAECDQVLIIWRDYLQDCIKLGMDVTDELILYPRDLEKMHQETMKRVQHYEDEQMRLKALKRYEQLVHYEFQYGEFFVKVPATAKEIIDEGNKLSHCVGGYAKNHVEGKTIILFLRCVNEPDKPFYTIELTSKQEVRQVRGQKNQAMTESVQAFIDVFKEQKLNKSKVRKAG